MLTALKSMQKCKYLIGFRQKFRLLETGLSISNE
jgi:hypothetical protein